jgi:hypothetical protein
MKPKLYPWKNGYSAWGINISSEDLANGSPKEGDMIATDPDNPDYKWLIAGEKDCDGLTKSGEGNHPAEG